MKELIRITGEIGPGTNSVFDLEDVFYVDQLGEETLCRLNRLGAKFITETAYGKDLCERMGLRLASNAEGVLSPGKRRGGKNLPIRGVGYAR